MGKYLEDNERKKLARLKKKIKRGKTLNEKQTAKLNELTAKREAGKKFSYSKNAKELAAEMQGAEVAAQKQQEYANVNVVNPFGTASYETDPVTGKFTQKTTLAEGQQKIKEQGEGLTQMGQQLAQQQLQGYQPFQMQDLSGERMRIEDEVFNRLTRNTERDYQREKDQLEQTLYNRGIPLDSGNPRYQREMQALNERYDTFKQDARARATEMGGQEFQRSYGIGLGSHQQGMQDLGTLQQMGIGLQVPSFAAPQGGNFQMQSPSGLQSVAQSIASMKAGDKLGQDQLALQKGLGYGQLAVQQGQLALAQQQQNQQQQGPPIEGV